MNEVWKKISTLLHFAVKSGNLVIGYNSIIKMKSVKTGLILIDERTSSNTVKDIKKKFPDTMQILLKKETSPDVLLGKQGIKLIALKRSELGKKIKEYIKTLEI